MNLLLADEAWVTQFALVENSRYSKGYHEGLDYVPRGRQEWGLFAPTGGRVMWTGWGDVYGWNIILFDERSGLSWRWCHLEGAILVKEGQYVRGGELMGLGGSSGNSDARHFHLNCIPMLMSAPGKYTYGKKAFPGNGYEGRCDPIPARRELGVWI